MDDQNQTPPFEEYDIPGFGRVIGVEGSQRIIRLLDGRTVGIEEGKEAEFAAANVLTPPSE